MMPAPHFVFRFSESTSGPGVAGAIETPVGSNDIDLTYFKDYDRVLTIQCNTPFDPTVGKGVDGMRVLEAVNLSIHHPAIQEVMRSEPENQIVIRNSSGISNDTESDEGFIYRTYTLSLNATIKTYFSLVRTDHTVDDYSLSGVLNTDSGDTIEIAIADAT